MWSLLDHLNALVLVPAVVLLFLAVQMGGQEAQIASTLRASGTGLYETVDWIERDLTNLGAGVAEGEPVLLDFSWGPGAERFTFRSGNDTTLAASATVIRYELADGVDSEHVELRRYEVGAAGPTLTARSPATLRTATIHLLDEAGGVVPADELDRARSVRIHLALDPPLGDAEGQTAWPRRFFPLHLARDG